MKTQTETADLQHVAQVLRRVALDEFFMPLRIEQAERMVQAVIDTLNGVDTIAKAEEADDADV